MRERSTTRGGESSRKAESGKARAYHHGNLRQALIQAALGLIDASGSSSFTLRELARAAGVTHAALYRHFATKDALLAEVAAEGFRGLLASVQAAAEEAGRDPLARLKRSSVGYVRFAIKCPAHFRVMFGPLEALADGAGLASALEFAFEFLLGLIRACQEAGQIDPGDPKEIALCTWATVHGLATLLVNGRLEIDGAGEIENVILRMTDLVEHGVARGGRRARAKSRPKFPELRIRGGLRGPVIP
jgi:AcrR family transcriptional regulator